MVPRWDFPRLVHIRSALSFAQADTDKDGRIRSTTLIEYAKDWMRDMCTCIGVEYQIPRVEHIPNDIRFPSRNASLVDVKVQLPTDECPDRNDHCLTAEIEEIDGRDCKARFTVPFNAEGDVTVRLNAEFRYRIKLAKRQRGSRLSEPVIIRTCECQPKGMSNVLTI